MVRLSFQVMTIGPPGRAWNEEFRPLGDGFPENVFCLDQKMASDGGTRKLMGREGTYDISAPFSASPISTTNSGSSYPSYPGPRFAGPYQTIPQSPKLTQPCKSATKPLMVSTIRHPDQINIELTNRVPPKTTAFLAPDGRLIPVDSTEFYGLSEAYQTLDPSTFSKNAEKIKENSGSAEGSKVTFNLEMLPMVQAGEATVNGGGFGRMLKNNILGVKGDETSKLPEKPIDDSRHEMVVYGKSTNHSSFV